MMFGCCAFAPKNPCLEQEQAELGPGEFAIVAERIERITVMKERLGVQVVLAIVPRYILPAEQAEAVAETGDIRYIEFDDAAGFQNSLHFRKRVQRGVREMLEDLAASNRIKARIWERVRVHFNVAGVVFDARVAVGGWHFSGAQKIQPTALVSEVGQHREQHPGTRTHIKDPVATLERKRDFGITVRAAYKNTFKPGMGVGRVVEFARLPKAH